MTMVQSKAYVVKYFPQSYFYDKDLEKKVQMGKVSHQRYVDDKE